MKLVRRTITIREDQAEWLDRRKSINLSGLVQEKLDEEMEK